MPNAKSGDSYVAFIDEAWANACQETGYTAESQCDIMGMVRAPGDVVLADAVSALCDDPANINAIRWFCACWLDRFPAAQRRALLAALCRFDPAYAALIYIWRTDLTEAEDKRLYAAFSPEMPAMVERLKRDPACRRKKRANG